MIQQKYPQISQEIGGEFMDTKTTYCEFHFSASFQKTRGKHIGTKCQEAFHTFWAVMRFFGKKNYRAQLEFYRDY